MIQRTMIAVLAAAALAAPAQAQVTVYGKADVGYNHVDSQNGALPHRAPTDLLESGSLSGTRLGFKAEEDVGKGWKALFHIEAGISADTGASTQAGLLYGRQAYAGMSSPYGKLTIGRHQTAQYALQADIDPFEIGTVGNIDNLVKRQSRIDNSAVYATPTWNGLDGSLLLSTNRAGQEQEGAATGEVPAAMIGARYRNGPLFLAAAVYSDRNRVSSVATRNGQVGGTYDFGPAKLHLVVGYNRTSDKKTDQTSFQAGVSVPAMGGSIRAAYSQLNEKGTTGTDAAKYALGYYYPWTPKLDIYTVVAHIENPTGGTVTFDNTDPIKAAGGVNGLSFGMRYTF